MAKLKPPSAKVLYRAYLGRLALAGSGLNNLGFDAGVHDSQTAGDETQRLITVLREGHDARLRFERAAGLVKR